MGLVSVVRSKDALAALARNRAEIISAVLPEVQTGKHYQRAEFSNKDHKSAGRKDAVLIAITVVMRCVFLG